MVEEAAKERSPEVRVPSQMRRSLRWALPYLAGLLITTGGMGLVHSALDEYTSQQTVAKFRKAAFRERIREARDARLANPEALIISIQQTSPENFSSDPGFSNSRFPSSTKRN